MGFRSTRIRTFDKSIVTVPNKNMISTMFFEIIQRKGAQWSILNWQYYHKFSRWSLKTY
ncbi:mechanosensitive ion channel [bacterium]|nr:mechanosensitive ion channel [bacterium]